MASVDVWLIDTETSFKSAGISTARLDALVLLEHATGKDRAWLLAHPDLILNSNFLEKVRKSLNRRIEREPLAYITGYKEFYGLDFTVTPHVLIPRPETEILVEYAVKHAPKNAVVLEIGTGSGCVAVALAANRPDLKVTATDISASALKVARQNARHHEVNVKFILSDLFSNSRLTTLNPRQILANLPYVPSGARHDPELDYEPPQALFAGPDGLDFYRRFLSDAGNFLAPGGNILIEASPVQKSKLESLAHNQNFQLRPLSEYIYRID